MPTKTKPAKMNATQRAYALARAAYDTAWAAYLAEVDAMNLDWDADFDAAFMAGEACRERHEIDTFRELLTAAEDAMMDWSLEASAKVGTPDQVAMARDVHARGRRLVNIRPKLIDLAFRLAA